MDLNKAESFIRRICEKTTAEELKWEKTPNDTTFQAAVGNFTIRFVKSDDHYSLELYDYKGVQLDTYADYYFDNQYVGPTLTSIAMHKYMEEAYIFARREALGVANALDDVLRELDKISGKWELISQAGSKPNPAYFLNFKSDGVLIDTKGRDGMKWKQDGTAITLCFPDGAFDHLVLSDDRKTLKGTNSIKQAVVYTFAGN